MSHAVFDLDPAPGNPRNSEGAFADLPDGSILFGYTHYTGGFEDSDPAYLASRRSTDGGRTWSQADGLLLPNEGKANVMSVSFQWLDHRRLAMFYLVKESKRADCLPYMRVSTDAGGSWGERRCCALWPGYQVVNNDRIVLLPGGRLLMPLADHSSPHTSRGTAYAFRSDDGGQTWQASNPVLPPPEGKSGLQEPGVVPLRDGRLWMLCRTDLGGQWQSFSEDGGETWRPAVPCEHFPAPCSPITVKRLPTGDLVAVWNDHSGRFPLPSAASHEANWGRTPLVSAVSRDEGKTWQHHRLLEDDEEHGYCYIALHCLPDAVLLGYCAGGPDCGIVLSRTRLRRLPLGWLYGE